MTAARIAAVATFLVLATGPVSAGIANTKHNLGSGGAAGNNKVSDTTEVCVFCHTPHQAETGTERPPLWNKSLGTLPRSGTYTTYSTTNSSTLDGSVLSVGSISLACLSCHDGTQAMDNIINAPGSGGVDATGGGVNGLGYTWSGTGVNAAGLMTSASALLGTDLTNDHPIGIQYCGGGPMTTNTAQVCRDGDFVTPQNATINGQVVFWIDTTGGNAGTRDKTDMILYNRAFAASGVGGTARAAGTYPSVECGSCHDPHVESGQANTGLPNSGATFLRVSNNSSAVCLACHVK